MSIKRWLFIHLLIMGLTGVVLVGCANQTLSSSEIEKSPFTGIPCAAPCWQGLIVGESNEEEVRSTLPKLTFIEQDTVLFHEMLLPSIDPSVYAPGIEISADCLRPKRQCLSLIIVDELLVEINLFLNYEIRLDEAIGYLGNPDFIGYQDSGTERISCQAMVVWKNKQLILGSEVFYNINDFQDNCESIPEANKAMLSLPISEIRYLSATNIESMLSSEIYHFFDFSGNSLQK